MFSREYTSTFFILLEFLEKEHKICHFWAGSCVGTGTKQGWYRYHLYRGKMVSVPRHSGTGIAHQNRVGTDTDPSGTGTTASCSVAFCNFYIVKLKFIHRGYRNSNE